jgi:uncharacterized protein (TIGR04222 family)
MDWIANMPGPQFLGLYAAVIVLTLVVAYMRLGASGRDDAPDPRVSTGPDPYQMAYLRGGDAEVGKLLLIELARRGYIQERTGATLSGGKVFLRQTDSHPSPALLPAPQRKVFEAVGVGEQSLQKLLRSREFGAAVSSITISFNETLGTDGLLVQSGKRLKVILTSALLIFGLGGFKLVVALSNGRYNVGFLLLLSLFALIALGAIASRRLTLRGRRYLNQTQDAYRGETADVIFDASSAQANSMLLHVGLFGAPILFGTAASGYATMLGLDPKRNYGSGGCGSGCGSGCSGGGGCGGGCGGCGGGD